MNHNFGPAGGTYSYHLCGLFLVHSIIHYISYLVYNTLTSLRVRLNSEPARGRYRYHLCGLFCAEYYALDNLDYVFICF